MKNLEQLKKELLEQLGVDYNLSNPELEKLIRLLKFIPKSERTKFTIQKLVQTITGFDQIIIKESFDNSDLDNIIDQIEDVLNKQ